MRTTRTPNLGLVLSLVALFTVASQLVPRWAWAQGAWGPKIFDVQPLFATPITADTTVEDDAIEGATTLTRSPGGLSMTLSATGLKPFHVYTVWWILFHKPWLCEHPIEGFGACSSPDLDNMSNTAVLRAAGAIADASGTLSVSGQLGVGRPPTGMRVRGQLLRPLPTSPFDSGWVPLVLPASEVHIGLAEHPEVDATTVTAEIANPGPVVAASIFAR